jgi:hypothetical protein
MDNVIDATERFREPRSEKKRPDQLDKLRQSNRTLRNDAILIARHLGEIAQKLSPKNPKAAARQWFKALWDGDRWEKRKRYILFANETAPDPVASNGADWAALIQQAATALFPDDSTTSAKERARICRDVLRGTSFLPATTTSPLRSDSAQTLIVALASKTCEAIEAETEIAELWDALEETPFDLHGYDFEQPQYDEEEINDPIIARIRASNRYEGDAFSRGPLGDAVRKAADVSRYRYQQLSGSSYRFEPRGGHGHEDWALPIIQFGLVGYRSKSRIFVIPQDFAKELPFDQEFEDGDKAPDERVFEWLVAKQIVPNAPYAKLPEITYSGEQGYGWSPFTFDVPRKVWLEARPRLDGSPGLWLSSPAPGWTHTYPVLSTMDTLAIQAALGMQSWLDFLPMSLKRSTYEYLEWPVYASAFMGDSGIPPGAFSGLLDLNTPEMSDVEGWIDDLENTELQEFLFRLEPDARFCPSIVSDDDLPPPCRAGTLAAAIFSNAGSALDDRIAMQFIRQAKVISENGLAFHAAFLATHRARIDRLIAE